jgi:hypothetical protein
MVGSEMKLPRSVMVPAVWASEDPTKVCIRTPTENPDTYYETILTVDEADMLSFWLKADVVRARSRIASEEWLTKQKKG